MNKYLTNLTPMRGIAALLTVIFHVDLMLGFGGDMLIKRSHSMVLSRMYLMVDFFFILSGFIMCHVYGKMFSIKVNKSSFKKFTIARFARVYPLHLLTLCYCIVLFSITAKLGIPKIPVFQLENNAYSVATNLLLLHSMNFNRWFSWDHASWSISTEWWAYMIFPFLVVPFQKLKNSSKAIVALVCFAGYLCIAFFIIPLVTIPKEIPFVKIDPSQMSVNVAYQYGYLRCLCGFILGMVVYEAYRLHWLKNIFSNGYMLVCLFLLVLVCMHLNLPDFITIIFFPFILLCGAFGSPNTDKLFKTVALQKLGDWSFSIYLTHQPLLFTITAVMAYVNPIDPRKGPMGPPPKPDIFTAWLICMGCIALVLLVSYFTYSYFEVPARNWINKKSKQTSTN